VKIWSDGCGKHFKTYPTHFYLAELQQEFSIELKWSFLPANDAHNRADGAAAHLAQAFVCFCLEVMWPSRYQARRSSALVECLKTQRLL